MSILVETDSQQAVPSNQTLATLGLTSKQTNIDDGLVKFMEALEEIDENGPLAKLNATSISDNNGGRVLL